MSIIPKDLIDKAKNILKEKQAFIIAEEKSLREFNEVNLKSFCPFHEENTPSFIWNTKKHYYKCFGCGATLDIIDHYILDGYSFIEASLKLFKLTNINFHIELPIKVKDYKYPKIEKNTNRKKVEKYLSLRKISLKTIEYADVKEDSKGNIVFEYYDLNKTLVTVKYRPAGKLKKGENKSWCQKDADTSPVLYGMHQIDTSKPLVITEGEIDRLACIEAGYKNAVSIPFGSSSTSWIEFNWEWLEQFDKIIIWSDNDDAGRKMNDTIIPRLGIWRCYVAKGIEKDINLELFKHGKDAVLKVIEEARDIPITDIIDLADIENYDITNAEGIFTNIKGIDKFLGKFYFGTVDMIVGINGSGKSTIINQILVAEAIEQGYQTFIFSGELTKQALKSWIDFPIAGKKRIKVVNRGKFQPKGYRIDEKTLELMSNWYKGKVHVYDKEFNIIASELLNKMQELARKYGVKNFVLDNLMMINCSEYNKYNSYEAEVIFVLKLCEFARNFNVVVHLLNHPSKIDSIRRLTKMDVAGMAKLTNLVHYVLAIHRVTEKEKEGTTNLRGESVIAPIKYDCLIDILKNRPTGHQDKTIGCYFDPASKRFYGDSDNVNRQYSWDNTEEEQEEEFISTEVQGADEDLPY